ncbi:hypothetical protein D3C71_1087330 [compost metagenome]
MLSDQGAQQALGVAHRAAELRTRVVQRTRYAGASSRHRVCEPKTGDSQLDSAALRGRFLQNRNCGRWLAVETGENQAQRRQPVLRCDLHASDHLQCALPGLASPATVPFQSG